MLALADAAIAAEVRDFTPGGGGPSATVVVSPGFSIVGFLPLIRRFSADGFDVHTVEFACAGQTRAELEQELRTSLSALPPGQTLVAHGLGATVALGAKPDVKRYILLAPLLDIRPMAATSWAAALPTGPSVDLTPSPEWSGQSLKDVLLGEPPPLTCGSGPLVREVQGWVREGHIPLALEEVDAPVWIGVSLGDELATVEAVIPAARRLPNRTILRLGLNALQGRDFSHGAMLTHRIPLRAAVRAARHRKPR